jgi:hypothetical protein
LIFVTSSTYFFDKSSIPDNYWITATARLDKALRSADCARMLLRAFHNAELREVADALVALE